MKQATRRRLGATIKVARTLTATETRVARRWFSRKTAAELYSIRLRQGSGRLGVVNGGLCHG